ncbi:MAG: oligopeptide/dipeptide ABC transporter ATP-binding protein [Alphaproteobacteria bacterium]
MHPHTQALIDAILTPGPADRHIARRSGLEGDVPGTINPPGGCRFHTRCPKRMDVCSRGNAASGPRRARPRGCLFSLSLIQGAAVRPPTAKEGSRNEARRIRQV